MMKRVKLLIFVVFLSFKLFSQNVNISGYIKDAATGERLIGANVYDTNTYKSTVSNNYGFYSIRFSRGDTVNLLCSYVGFVKQSWRLVLYKDTMINISLKAGKTIQEVKVTAKRNIPIEQRAQTSMIEIPMKSIKLMPQLMGESNLLKTIQMLPGVKRGNEGSSAIYVRGGSPDQNLILLDEVPLYYVSHYGGFFSIFNSDAISNVRVIKGGFPARYGGRLSSVIDVRMKEGNNQKFQATASIGLMSSKISIEGPIIQGKTSYILSLRRSFWDLFSSAFTYLRNNTAQGFSFYDINAKINHEFSKKNKIYLSFYTGADDFYTLVKEKKGFDYTFKNKTLWGNLASSFRWNHLYGSSLFSNFTLIYSKYRLGYTVNYESSNIHEKNDFISWIEDIGAKIDYEYNTVFNHKLRFGSDAVYRTFNPGQFSYYTKDSTGFVNDTAYGSQKLYAAEWTAYFEDEFKIGKRFFANLGLHFSKYYIQNEQFYSYEPRINVNLLFAPTMSIKSSFVKMQQYIHLLTNSGVGMPTDLWVPATGFAQPQQSYQATLGFAKTFYEKQFELSVESYYKTMDNLIAYSEGTTFYTGKDWQEKIETDGKGLSYGVELLAQKKMGKFTGWIGYTWSKTTRQFKNINNGNPYNFRYDRTHDASIVLNYVIDKHWTFSANWVYSTGDALTLAQGKYNTVNNMANPWSLQYNYDIQAHIYAGRNSFRGRSYHRLDIGLNYTKKKKKGDAVWSFSIYNVYNRKNPSYYMYDRYLNTNNLLMVTEFPFLPSVSYSFVF